MRQRTVVLDYILAVTLLLMIHVETKDSAPLTAKGAHVGVGQRNLNHRSKTPIRKVEKQEQSPSRSLDDPVQPQQMELWYGSSYWGTTTSEDAGFSSNIALPTPSPVNAAFPDAIPLPTMPPMFQPVSPTWNVPTATPTFGSIPTLFLPTLNPVTLLPVMDSTTFDPTPSPTEALFGQQVSTMSPTSTMPVIAMTIMDPTTASPTELIFDEQMATTIPSTVLPTSRIATTNPTEAPTVSLVGQQLTECSAYPSCGVTVGQCCPTDGGTTLECCDGVTTPGITGIRLFDGSTFLANLDGFTIDLNEISAASLVLVAVTRDQELISTIRFTLGSFAPIIVEPNSNGQFVLGPLGDIAVPALVSDGTFDVSAAAFSATDSLFNVVTASVTVIAETMPPTRAITATPVISPITVPPTSSPTGTFMPTEKGASCALYPSCPQTGGDCCPTPGGVVLSCCNPTEEPTRIPTFLPTLGPTSTPTSLPTTGFPSPDPSASPSLTQTEIPTQGPTLSHSGQPTFNPSLRPSKTPTREPTSKPTAAPTSTPTESLSGQQDTDSPTTPISTAIPSRNPTKRPVASPTSAPTVSPTKRPTPAPTKRPTGAPTKRPTARPTRSPVEAPTRPPSQSPTKRPTFAPTRAPTFAPTRAPTFAPTRAPITRVPVNTPTVSPTTAKPTVAPTDAPTNLPSEAPTAAPITDSPTSQPVIGPTTEFPTGSPSSVPTGNPIIGTAAPSTRPSTSPIGAVLPTGSPVVSFNFDQRLFSVENVEIQLRRASVRRLQQGTSCGLEAWTNKIRQDILEEINQSVALVEESTVTIENPRSETISNSLTLFFDVTIGIRAPLPPTEAEIEQFIAGPYDIEVERRDFAEFLRRTNCQEFRTVESISNVVIPSATQEPVTGDKSATGPDASLIGLIVGLSLAGVAIILLGATFIYLRSRRTQERHEHDGVVPLVYTHPEQFDHNEYANEIGVGLNNDVSTLGDPIPKGATGAAVGDQSTIGSQSLEYDYQKAFVDQNSIADSRAVGSAEGGQSRLMTLNTPEDPALTGNFADDVDNDTYDSNMTTEEQYEVIAPAGLLGLILESNLEDGRPMVNNVKPTSVLATVVKIGDRLMSVDGADVTKFSANDVSHLLASKKDQPSRVMVFARSIIRAPFSESEGVSEMG